jgi:hypothetical protein
MQLSDCCLLYDRGQATKSVLTRGNVRYAVSLAREYGDGHKLGAEGLQ